jgi:hypothetical protein
MLSASLAEVLAENIPQASARQRAVAAARKISEHKTRDELRLLLQRELDRHGTTMDAQAMETAVDLLAAERQSFGKARVALRVLNALGASARKRREVSPTTPLRDLNTVSGRQPAWCRTPERAAYPITNVDGHTVEVDLEQNADAYLERIAELDLPSIDDIKYLEVWFTLSRELPTQHPKLDVHVGTQCLGTLNETITKHLMPAMDAAADRDEDPWMIASLSTSTGTMPYLLEITVPEERES